MLPLGKAHGADVVKRPHAVAYHDTAGLAWHVASASRAERVLLFVGIRTVHPMGTLSIAEGRQADADSAQIKCEAEVTVGFFFNE